MKPKRKLKYHRPGDVAGLERTLNAMSAAGWQALRPGRLIQTYRPGTERFVHRFGYCAAAKGSADEITYASKNSLAGWEAAAQRRGWILYRKMADQAAEDERLPQDRAPIRKLFEARIARLESLRRVLLVLGSALLIIGYASSLLPVLYACVIPLAGVIPVTYLIKFFTEGAAR